MALDTPVKISAQFIDALGIRAATQFYGLVDSSQTLSAILTEADLMRGELQNLSGAQMKYANLAIDIADPAAAPPLAASRVEQCGMFNFSASSTSRRWAAMVPGFLNSIIVNGKPDLTNAGLISWINALVNTGGVLQFTTPEQLQLLALRDAFIAFHKHRKSLSRTSYET